MAAKMNIEIEIALTDENDQEVLILSNYGEDPEMVIFKAPGSDIDLIIDISELETALSIIRTKLTEFSKT